jgi:apolipoprotein D and lipocalin family protein
MPYDCLTSLYCTSKLRALCLIALFFLSGCTDIPEGVVPVRGFELERYLGKWFEIARLDHSFERGLVDVSATYTKRSDGGVDVVNRGFDPFEQSRREAKGRAYFIGPTDTASLKVSFFGPFYVGYHVMRLDPEYRWAMVAGPTHEYLWILSRTRSLPDDVMQFLLQAAQQAGFDTDRLIVVGHDGAMAEGE